MGKELYGKRFNLKNTALMLLRVRGDFLAETCVIMIEEYSETRQF